MTPITDRLTVEGPYMNGGFLLRTIVGGEFVSARYLSAVEAAALVAALTPTAEKNDAPVWHRPSDDTFHLASGVLDRASAQSVVESLGNLLATGAAVPGPQEGTCQACGHRQPVANGNTPMPSSLAMQGWRCEQCGGQVVVTFTIGTVPSSPARAEGPTTDTTEPSWIASRMQAVNSVAALGSQGVPARNGMMPLPNAATTPSSHARAEGPTPSWGPIIKCPTCGHACGNEIDPERGITIRCQYCGYRHEPGAAPGAELLDALVELQDASRARSKARRDAARERVKALTGLDVTGKLRHISPPQGQEER